MHTSSYKCANVDTLLLVFRTRLLMTECESANGHANGDVRMQHVLGSCVMKEAYKETQEKVAEKQAKELAFDRKLSNKVDEDATLLYG